MAIHLLDCESAAGALRSPARTHSTTASRHHGRTGDGAARCIGEDRQPCGPTSRHGLAVPQDMGASRLTGTRPIGDAGSLRALSRTLVGGGLTPSGALVHAPPYAAISG